MATQAECARWCDISERRFRELVDEGVITRAERGNYDLLATVQEYIRNLRATAAGRIETTNIQKADEDARLARARADKAEMELAEARSELVPVDQIADVWNAQVQIMKQRLRSIPTKAAPRVGARDAALAEQVIREAVDEALTALAQGEVTTAG